MKRIFKGALLLLLAACLLLPLFSCAKKEGEDEAPERVGVVTGTVLDAIAREHYPDAEIVYFNTVPDMVLALLSGKIDYYVDDEPTVNMTAREYRELHSFGYLADDSYAFAFPFGKEKLRDQMNEFLRHLREDGTLTELQEKWISGDEVTEAPELLHEEGKNGTLTLATNVSNGTPFAYYKAGKYYGYEIDLATRFCRTYGYGLSIMDLDFSGMIAAVTTGKADFAAACITVTEERKETLLFSDIDYKSSILTVTAKELAEEEDIVSLSGLKDRAVGVQVASIVSEAAKKHLPDAKFTEYRTAREMASALENDRISAYIADEPIALALQRIYPDQRSIISLSQDLYAFAFPKEREQSAALQARFDAFLSSCAEDGTLTELQDIWMGEDESRKQVEREGLTGENGVLSMAVSGEVGAPFTYRRDGELVGFDIDLAVRFCRAEGYGLRIVDYSLGDLIPTISAGSCDFGASCLTVDEAREDTILFSDPVYRGDTVVVSKYTEKEADGSITSVDQLAGKTTGVQVGTVLDTVAEKYIPDCTVDYYNSTVDLAVALEAGKITSYVADEPLARLLCREYDNHRILSQLSIESYAFAFPRVNEGSQKLWAQMETFLDECRADGTMKELDEIWFGEDEELQKVDFKSLTGENGTLEMIVCSAVGAPFCYMHKSDLVGYDIDLAVRFCKKYGYALHPVDYNIAGLFTAIAAGKCDLAASCLTVTQERKETLLFSQPVYAGGTVVVVRDEVQAKNENGFFHSVKQSFEKTFIREDRWKLFLSGIGVTLLVALLSLFGGTLVGFGAYLGYRVCGTIFRRCVDGFCNFLEKTPCVVILMIFYYILFGSLTVDGMWVSVLGFTLLFAGRVLGVIKVGVGAVPPGQREAALALGYSETGAFFRIVLPQAARHFLPGYKSAIVSLVKDTSIVGYIAVQDLTKVSDIVRSRTYDAFFPLIATAAIYFGIAWLLTALIRRLEIDIDPARRKHIRLLREVNRK